MKKLTIAFCASIILLACTNDASDKKNLTNDSGTTAVTAPETTSTSESIPDSATMMKNWQEYMTPGDPHKMMQSWDGAWDADISMWFTPDGPPMTSKGSAVNKTILGGRYQVSEHKGNFMGDQLDGRSTLAYDNFKKAFISTWIDNFGTGVMSMEGTWDEASKTINFKGKMVDPTIKKEVDVRETFQIVDNDHQVMEMFGPGPDGKEFKTMQIKFSRKK